MMEPDETDFLANVTTERDVANQEIQRLNKNLKEGADYWTKFRQQLRQLLADFGTPSNPGFSEDDIVHGLRSQLTAANAKVEKLRGGIGA